MNGIFHSNGGEALRCSFLASKWSEMSQNAKKFFHLVEKINKFPFNGGGGGACQMSLNGNYIHFIFLSFTGHIGLWFSK